MRAVDLFGAVGKMLDPRQLPDLIQEFHVYPLGRAKEIRRPNRQNCDKYG
jgi:hypothetical protein